MCSGRRRWRILFIASLTGRYGAAFTVGRCFLTTRGLNRKTWSIFSDELGSSAGTPSGTLEAPETPETPKDEEEWQTLISALNMYKAAYGDLKVPNRFVVPALPPWPESAHELKLGQRVAQIRSTGKYTSSSPMRREILDSMGFLWRLRAPSSAGGPPPSADRVPGVSATLPQIFAALEQYKELRGNLEIEKNFCVPDLEEWPLECRGLPLGQEVSAIRSKSYLRTQPGSVRDKLVTMGLNLDGKMAANDARYERVLRALRIYKEKQGDLLVSQPWQVPTGDEWPEDLWELRLGARVNAIRSQGTFVKNHPKRKEELTELGFVWEPPSGVLGGKKKRGRKRKVENEALMGKAPPGMLSEETDKKEEDNMSLWDMLTEEGLGMMKQDNVPSNSIIAKMETNQIPEDEEYEPYRPFEETVVPMALKAQEIGIIESADFKYRAKKGRIDVQHPWFNDDFGGGFTFDNVVEAFTFYKSIHQNFDELLKEGEDFIVPADPFMTTLDSQDDATSSRAAAQAISQTEEPESLIQEEIARLSLQLQAPTATAASPSATWPAHLATMNLSSLTRRIRQGDLEVAHIPSRKAQLDALDFPFGLVESFLEIPFDKTLCALYAYHSIRGDLFVERDFLVPADDPWPASLRGFPLGDAVFYLRKKQKFIETHHPPRKMYVLNMLEFVWFPADAEPLDPSAQALSWEKEQVATIGHPLARINDVPYHAVEGALLESKEEDRRGRGMLDESTNLSSEDFNAKGTSFQKPEFDFETVRDYYENDLGIYDIGQFLRERGYFELADEHEEKYGVGTPPPQEPEDSWEEEIEEEEYDDDLDDENLDDIDIDAEYEEGEDPEEDVEDEDDIEDEDDDGEEEEDQDDDDEEEIVEEEL